CCGPITSGFASPQRAEAEEMRQRGRLAAQAGEYREAERWFRAALEEFEADKAAVSIAQTLGDLAGDLIGQERYWEAEEPLQRAIRILKTQPATDQHAMPILLGNLATVYELTLRFEPAERAFREAGRAAEKYLGRDAPYSAILLNNLGAL